MQSIEINKTVAHIIASGSSGNCLIYHNTIMIDCGVPYSLIKPYVSDLQIVLLTHVHKDHINIRTLKKIVQERPTLRIGCGVWMLEYLEGIDRRNIDVYEFAKWYDYGHFKLSIGKLYHDVPNCFYRIDKNSYKIFHATDTGHLEGISAYGYDLYALEYNHDEETALKVIEEARRKGEFTHLIGSMRTHLSEQQANEFYYKNRAEHSQVIRLHETKSYL